MRGSYSLLLIQINAMQIISPHIYAQKLNEHDAAMGTDQTVNHAVRCAIDDLLQPATHVPVGHGVRAELLKPFPHGDTLSADIQALFNRNKPGLSALVFLGECRQDEEDQKRALDFLDGIAQNKLATDLVIFERGMNYKLPEQVPYLIESQLTQAGPVDFGWGLTRRQRNMILAGYLVLCLASGDQRDKSNILLFFNESQRNVFSMIDHYAHHTDAYYLNNKPRTFVTIRSNTQVKRSITA